MTINDYVKYCANFGLRPEFERCIIENADVDKFNHEIYLQALNWGTVKNEKGFYIHGEPGTGKSFVLKMKANFLYMEKLKIITHRIDDSKYPQWIELTNYLKELMPNGTFDKERAFRIERYIQTVENADWLFIDDFGATTKTDWAIDQVFKLIDARVMNKKQTFISSNLNRYDIEEFYGKRIASRIFELCTFIELRGPDRRKM